MTGETATTDRRAPMSAAAGVLIVALCLLSLALNHQYRGLFHDARLYLLQALGHLSPDSLSQDIFMRYGSQERYTLFSAPVALMIRLMGAEHAAAAVTLGSQVALLAGAWLLARAAAPRTFPLLGVAVLIAFPGTFGMHGLFMVIEPFMTPRMLAEALVLAGLAAALTGRSKLALLLVAGALVCHPLMAMAGVVALAVWYAGVLWRRFSVVAILCGIVALLAWTAWRPPGLFASFDSHWFGLVSQRSPTLFLRYWDVYDWARLVPLLGTLIVGWSCLIEPSSRKLCAASLMTIVVGIVLTAIACDGMHLVLFTQLQPWRWQWLGYCAAALLLPAILRARWSEGAAARPTVLLLAALWVFGDYPGSILVGGLAIASLAVPSVGTARQVRLLWAGACGVLAIACTWRILSSLQFTSAAFFDNRLPNWLRMLISAVSDGTLWAAIMVLICWADNWAKTPRRTTWLVLGTAALATAVVIAPVTLAQWSAREFTADDSEALAPFRAKIPPGTAVMWDGPADAAWVLLDRPDYLVPAETAGMLYSREAALEMERRARALSAEIPTDEFLKFDAPLELNLSAQQMAGICSTGEVRFLITYKDLGFEPVSRVQLRSERGGERLKLYDCPGGRAESRIS